MRPPRLASLFLAMLAGKKDGGVISGDLEEEFAGRARENPRAAALWFWRQTLASAPSLALYRAQRFCIADIAALLALTAGAFLFLSGWNTHISAGMARRFYEGSSTDDYTIARAAYFAARAAGFAIAGAALHFVMQRTKPIPFAVSTRERLAPAAVILFLPSMIAMLSGQTAYPMPMRVLQILLGAAPFIGGAYVAHIAIARR